ncbi:cytochrome b [Porphyrobacter algicida]|uniref:Cytochrome b n=1 Tax=Qipengyuania algicida TaxID=1836209 RepID=A0A845AME4_9SPHN|nr:cytochrome b [Qipengyuania algicida]MXP30055.1 cytochrome b [Qipengyuania algicida]
MVVNATNRTRYSVVAMLFHWTIAVLVILNWRLAENAHHAKGAAGAALMGDHKAFGILILVLTLGRLLWRLGHPVPPLPTNYANWEKIVARTTHVIFYVLLIALPLGAWIANSLGGRSIDFFGWFTIPPLPIGQNKGLSREIFELHGTFGMILIYLVGLHILGALKHTFFDKDGGIFRMLPFGKVAGE